MRASATGLDGGGARNPYGVAIEARYDTNGKNETEAIVSVGQAAVREISIVEKLESCLCMDDFENGTRRNCGCGWQFHPSFEFARYARRIDRVSKCVSVQRDFHNTWIVDF